MKTTRNVQCSTNVSSLHTESWCPYPIFQMGSPLQGHMDQMRTQSYVLYTEKCNRLASAQENQYAKACLKN